MVALARTETLSVPIPVPVPEVPEATQVDEVPEAGDYPFVTSVPPAAVAGKLFGYQLAVKSKKPASEFKLVSGPTDLEVSADGRVRWPVPETFDRAASVVVAISDETGKEYRHEFDLIPTLPPPE